MNTPNQSNKVVLLVLALIGLFCLALPLITLSKAPYLLLTFGRTHPLVVHFPIALIVLLFFIEVLRYFNPEAVSQKMVTFILWLTNGATVLSLLAGYFLFASGGYSGDTVTGHLWWASGTGVIVTIATGLHYTRINTPRFEKYYRVAVVAGTITVTVAGHLGGVLTHGKGYLTEYVPYIIHKSSLDKIKPVEEMLVYEDMVAPVLHSKCVGCHNEDKKKGDLLMTTLDGLLKGGESEKPTLTPSVPEESELYIRVALSPDHDDHMPPEGKTPLTDDEKDLLKYWISAGASAGMRVEEVRNDPSVGQVVERLLPGLLDYQKTRVLQAIETGALKEELSEVAENLGVDIYESPSPEDEGLFTLAMKFPPAPMTNEQFKELRPYNSVFSRLSLVSSDLDDAGLFYVSQMSGVRELYLQKTKIDGSGIIYLKDMEGLEVLNLSFTDVDDKAAIDLLKIPGLKTVYLFGTNTTNEVVEALRKNRPDLQILLEEGPYF